MKKSLKTEDIFKISLSMSSIQDIFHNYIRKKNIIGIDNVDNSSFSKRLSYYSEYISSNVDNLVFSPYIEKLISKGRYSEPRVISIPTIKDRIILYALKEILHYIFPNSVNKEIVNLKIRETAEIIKQNKKMKILRLDISGFYDNINQGILLSKLEHKIKSSLLLSLIDKAISNPTVPKNYSRNERVDYIQNTGIPQGLSISNCLANLYLHDFDTKIRNECKYYYRYVDDILVIHDAHAIDNLYRKVRKELTRLGLSINEAKTKTYFFSDSITFLGYSISNGQISIKQESIQSHINSIFALLSRHNRIYHNIDLRDKWLREDDETYIKRIESDINEKITGAISENKKYGWLFYFSSIDNTDLLHKLNNILFNAVNRIFPEDVCNMLHLKSYVRAFYEIRNNPRDGYIENYDEYDTMEKRMQYLNFRGYIDKSHEYTAEEIDYLFMTIREKHIAVMLKDIGDLS